MSILFGTIAHHQTHSFLQRAISPSALKGHTLSHGFANAERVEREQPSSLNDCSSNTSASVISLSTHPHSASPTVFRDRVLVSILGHIENRAQLLNKLESFAYAPQTHQQEEMLAALIDWYHRQHKDILVATRLALAEAEGYFACCVLTPGINPSLICASKGPALYLAQNQYGSHFSSDANLIREHAALFIQLDHDEVALLEAQQISCVDYAGKIRHKDPIPAHTAGQYAHHMQADILAQPLIAAELIAAYQNQQLTAALKQLNHSTPFARVLLLASGSSHHAALTAQHWFEQLAALPCKVAYSSEYRYSQPIYEPNTLVIAISQSGETTDTIAALQLAINTGHQDTVALCNQADSTLSKLAHITLLQFAGVELGAVSTKTFTSQLLCLYFVALHFSPASSTLAKQAQAELDQLPNSLAQTLKLAAALKNWTMQLANVNNIFFVGRHIHLPIAQEAAQKTKEIAYIHAEAYPSGELKHGPVTLINQSTPVIACLPWDRMADKTLANLQEVKARHGEIYILSDVGLSSSAHFHCIKMPRQLHNLNPLLYAVAFQLLSYLIALNRGNDIDTPRYISKAFNQDDA